MSIALGILNSRQDADECINDAYLKIWQAIPPMRPDSLKGFIGRIVRNVCLDRREYLNAKKRSKGCEVPFEELYNMLPDERISPDVKDSEITDALNGFLETLEKDVRIMFVRRYWYLDSVKVIASRMGFSQSKVKTTLFRTRERLRKYLGERGIDV